MQRRGLPWHPEDTDGDQIARHREHAIELYELLLRVDGRLSLHPDETGIQAVTAAVKIVLRHYVDTREISLLRYKLVSEVPALREREIVSRSSLPSLPRPSSPPESIRPVRIVPSSSYVHS